MLRATIWQRYGKYLEVSEKSGGYFSVVGIIGNVGEKVFYEI